MDVRSALDRVRGALPAGEERPGQVAMAEAVERAIERERHLIVQAGTGTGKSLGYLVPAILSGRRVVVATATKALQDQLAGKDLPFLARHLGVPFDAAVLKGRANYLCRQRADEVAGGDDQLSLDDVSGDVGALGRDVVRLVEWGRTTTSGDRSDLDFEPRARAWAAVSVGSTECPGALKCPSGDGCFAEAARRRAEDADVVVVNTALYGAHLASGGHVLPEHDVVVFDEAHALEDVAAESLGLELGGGRVRAVVRWARPLVGPDDGDAVDDLEAAATRLEEASGPWRDRRVPPGDLGGDLGAAVELATQRLSRVTAAVRAGDGDAARRARALQAAGHLAADLAVAASVPDGSVAWVEGRPGGPVLRMVPVDVGELLAARLWDHVTAVLTSATVPPLLSTRVGIAADRCDELDVGSPFPHADHALLYCAAHLPDPRSPRSSDAVHDELEALVRAAGGRTLALFTSWRAMQAAVEALRPRLPWTVLAQGDLPKPALVEAFASEERSCLFATMGYWQGIDVPGSSLSLVTIDRIPFPRPDEPLVQARRERAGPGAFRLVDLPRAATLLAQGAGRLVRSATDRGVVAVLDPRLASAGYRWDLVRALPPMRRTRHRAEVEAFLSAALDPE
ncbi:MAG: ATP-dependent DNA helicase [Acidimicrobiia bacterium]